MTYNQKAEMAAHRGAQNRTKGKVFEEYIEAACRAYDSCGLAHIMKTPEPFHITRSLGGGKFEGNFSKQAQPDFSGTLVGGRSIYFDAKMTDTGKIPVSALTSEQIRELEYHTAMGAVTGVLGCFSFQMFAFIPFKDFINAKEINGHKHWTIEDCRGYEVKFNGYVKFLEEIS